MNDMNRIKKLLIAFILIVAAGVFNSCEKYQFNPPTVDPNTTWRFSTDIQPIFNSKCALASCHGGPVSPNLSAGKAFQSLTTGGYVKTPGESSRIYKQLTTDPSHQARATEADRLKILYWINQGAKNN